MPQIVEHSQHSNAWILDRILSYRNPQLFKVRKDSLATFKSNYGKSKKVPRGHEKLT